MFDICDVLRKLELKLPLWTIDGVGIQFSVILLSQISTIWKSYLLGGFFDGDPLIRWSTVRFFETNWFRVASLEEIESSCPSPYSHQPFFRQMTMIRIAGRWVLKWMRARWVAHRIMSNLHWPWARPGYELKWFAGGHCFSLMTGGRSRVDSAKRFVRGNLLTTVKLNGHLVLPLTASLERQQHVLDPQHIRMKLESKRQNGWMAGHPRLNITSTNFEFALSFHARRSHLHSILYYPSATSQSPMCTHYH